MSHNTHATPRPISHYGVTLTLSSMIKTNPSIASSFSMNEIATQTRTTAGEALVAYDPYQFGRDCFSTKNHLVVDHISHWP